MAVLKRYWPKQNIENSRNWDAINQTRGKLEEGEKSVLLVTFFPRAWLIPSQVDEIHGEEGVFVLPRDGVGSHTLTRAVSEPSPSFGRAFNDFMAKCRAEPSSSFFKKLDKSSTLAIWHHFPRFCTILCELAPEDMVFRAFFRATSQALQSSQAFVS